MDLATLKTTSMKFDFPSFVDPDTARQVINLANPQAVHILWDLDETLVSHQDFVFDRINRGLFELHEYQMTLQDKEQLKQQLIEIGTDDILDFTREKIFQKVDIQGLLYFLREDKSFTNNFVRTGTLALLKELKSNLSMRICTNGNFSQQSKKMNHLIEEIGFSLPVSYCSLIVPKPAPTCLLYSLEGHPSENVLFIGDSWVDIQAANSAGIPFLNVSSLIGAE